MYLVTCVSKSIFAPLDEWHIQPGVTDKITIEPTLYSIYWIKWTNSSPHLIHPSIHFICIFHWALFHLTLYKNHIIPDDPRGGSVGVHSLFIYDTFCPPGDIWLLTQLSVISADRKIQNTLTHHSTWEMVFLVSPTDLYHGMCLWQECHHLSLCFSANPYLGTSPIPSGCFIRFVARQGNRIDALT